MGKLAAKKYIFTAAILLVIFVSFFAVTAFLGSEENGSSEEREYTRGNFSCPTERVFDYADKLTEAEEESLREKIEDAEEKTGCDIIVVILEESLEEYAKSYEDQIGPVEPYQYTMVFADNFYDENGFGFNEPHGDGILLLDNWYREADGSLYSWISTSGKVQQHYSSSMIDGLMNAFIDQVQIDAASGYELFVELVEEEMSNRGTEEFFLSWWMIVGIATAAALIFFFLNYGGRKGRKTIVAATYVKSGRPEVRVREDQFLTKTVTKRKIQTSSGPKGGGGGGSHVSAGGFSHGGGGGRR